ncbi:MFS transporter [Paraburkholderia susongensis]|uniref:MFS transporter, AAHS family, 4-hydroxybenzoate transporter n=1 Tax=Paraburkholderia susongensis TaxID=1515439 RepID=A0A1X7LKE0_9BURK|nr:MFS transporter [Paraburkholderia susongensis]SMG53629.1 MFS transporter, AAHS family, 4-hydroxybenzoate transporter [Paraburkholderia susongensis]
MIQSGLRAPESPARTAALRITLVCFAVSMIDGFDTLMLSFVAPLLVKSLHIDHASLGRVFGAGFLGTVLGSILIGPAADRFGRRPMLLLSLALTGVLTLACATATSAPMLATLRFIGGLGMGGAIPVVAAITAQNSPTRSRASLVILMFIGFPLGAVVGGAITAALMMKFGWPFVFLMGGAGALAAMVPVWFVIPAGATPRDARLASAQRRPRSLNPFGHTLADGRAPAAIALWCGVLATMILSGFLVNFMPTILNLNGIAPDRAAMGAVLINVGAILGALALSAIVGRFGPFRPVVAVFVAGAGLTIALGQLIGVGNGVFAMLFCIGACLVGGQLTFPAIASRLFPDDVRAGGVGWTMAIGRAGSIIGPLVGGMLLAAHLPLERIFQMVGLLALCGALGVALAYRWQPGDATRRPSVGGGELSIADSELSNGKH